MSFLRRLFWGKNQSKTLAHSGKASGQILGETSGETSGQISGEKPKPSLEPKPQAKPQPELQADLESQSPRLGYYRNGLIKVGELEYSPPLLILFDRPKPLEPSDSQTLMDLLVKHAASLDLLLIGADIGRDSSQVAQMKAFAGKRGIMVEQMPIDATVRSLLATLSESRRVGAVFIST